MQAPLSIIEATTVQVVTSLIGLIVGLGVISGNEGQLIVSSAGVIIGGIVQIGNAIYALAHAKVAAAVLEHGTAAQARLIAKTVGA